MKKGPSADGPLTMSLGTGSSPGSIPHFTSAERRECCSGRYRRAIDVESVAYLDNASVGYQIIAAKIVDIRAAGTVGQAKVCGLQPTVDGCLGASLILPIGIYYSRVRYDPHVSMHHDIIGRHQAPAIILWLDIGAVVNKRTLGYKSYRLDAGVICRNSHIAALGIIRRIRHRTDAGKCPFHAVERPAPIRETRCGDLCRCHRDIGSLPINTPV